MKKSDNPDGFAPEKEMSKAALWPSLIVSLISLILSAIIKFGHHSHLSIFLGALAASALVIIFFGISNLISLVAPKVDPNIIMILAMFSFFLKLIFLGVGLALLGRFTSPAQVNRSSFLVTALIVILTWIVGEIVGFLRLHFQLPLPGTKL
jgi:ATP synthase protein I